MTVSCPIFITIVVNLKQLKVIIVLLIYLFILINWYTYLQEISSTFFQKALSFDKIYTCVINTQKTFSSVCGNLSMNTWTLLTSSKWRWMLFRYICLLWISETKLLYMTAAAVVIVKQEKLQHIFCKENCIEVIAE